MVAECRERTHGEHRAHLAAIDRIVERWMGGEISLADKRQLIAAENTFYRGKPHRGRTGKLVTADAGHGHIADDEDASDEWWNR